ncbi:hypothetical protein EGW08_005841 [Elysia chlorotica]|uniref:CUB domain-containing protein n=1 Tax=Elysia chlorotica TaxID=188477 RepID=A0A433TXS6_ELYCH|nr:hypothetical protein EGW08_005841 [Elysia chlorotica]
MQRSKTCTALTNLWLVLVLFIQLSCGRSEISTVYMNSYKMCGENGDYALSKDLMYQVKPDVSPETTTSTFRTCEMTFSVDDDHGRLCLAQDYPRVYIADKHAKLKAYDGLDESKLIFSVGYGEHWADTEKCTNSRYISLLLASDNPAQPVHITDITINLKVMHIASDRRRLDMAYDACEKTYPLDHSEVSVYNRQRPSDLKRTDGIELKIRCQVTFERQSSSDRSICFVYIPQGKPDCSSEWVLYVLKERNNLDEENILYKLDCKTDPKALKTHAWCAPNKTEHLTLLHYRNPDHVIWSNDSSVERPETYRVLVSDFPGGDVRELLRKTEARLAAQSGSNSAGFNMWWVLLAAGIGLLLVIGAFAYFSRRKRCGGNRSKDSEAAERESSIARREEEDDDDDVE